MTNREGRIAASCEIAAVEVRVCVCVSFKESQIRVYWWVKNWNMHLHWNNLYNHVVSYIIHCTKILFSSSTDKLFFLCCCIQKYSFFLNTSYKGLILRRCTFVTWWLLLVWQVKSWFDPAHAVLARDHPEFSRSQSWEIIRRQRWMTLSSFLIGRQAAWRAGCNQDTQRSSIWQRTSLQILRNKQIIRESTFFCFFFPSF